MAEIKKQIQISGNTVFYYITHRQQKNLILRVREGKIYISAPINVDQWEVEQIIYKNYRRILDVQSKYEYKPKYDLFSLNPWVMIFDQKVNIKLLNDNTHAKMVDGTIYMKDYFDVNIQLEKLYTFLAKYYKNWFINRTDQWATGMGVEYKNLSVKIIKSKWGVCYPTQSKIIYNTKLIHFSPTIIDYVIVHELNHLLHPNHSKDFWRSVGNFLPNYKQLQDELNKSGI